MDKEDVPREPSHLDMTSPPGATRRRLPGERNTCPGRPSTRPPTAQGTCLPPPQEPRPAPCIVCSLHPARWRGRAPRAACLRLLWPLGEARPGQAAGKPPGWPAARSSVTSSCCCTGARVCVSARQRRRGDLISVLFPLVALREGQCRPRRVSMRGAWRGASSIPGHVERPAPQCASTAVAFTGDCGLSTGPTRDLLGSVAPLPSVAGGVGGSVTHMSMSGVWALLSWGGDEMVCV